jgi:Flp pilus assembly secretin CpaC
MSQMAVLLALAAVPAATPDTALPAGVVPASPAEGVPVLRLEPGQAEVLILPLDIRRVAVTLPGVADVTLAGRRELLVQARGEGRTSLWVWHRGDRERREVVVAPSPSLFGRVKVHVQVLETRLTDRQEAGVTWGSPEQGPDAQVRYETGQMTFGETAPGALRPAGFGLVDRIAANARAMLRYGRARLLADPRLVADSGSEATFLVGGEVPVPVAQQFGNTTIALTLFIVFQKARQELNLLCGLYGAVASCSDHRDGNAEVDSAIHQHHCSNCTGPTQSPFTVHQYALAGACELFQLLSKLSNALRWGPTVNNRVVNPPDAV